MWGSWFGTTIAGVLILAGIVALIFGTSIAVFGILIALGIVAAIAVGFGLMRGTEKSDDVQRHSPAGAQPRNPRSGGAPAAGEGAAPAESAQAAHKPARAP